MGEYVVATYILNDRTIDARLACRQRECKEKQRDKQTDRGRDRKPFKYAGGCGVDRQNNAIGQPEKPKGPPFPSIVFWKRPAILSPARAEESAIWKTHF